MQNDYRSRLRTIEVERPDPLERRGPFIDLSVREIRDAVVGRRCARFIGELLETGILAEAPHVQPSCPSLPTFSTGDGAPSQRVLTADASRQSARYGRRRFLLQSHR